MVKAKKPALTPAMQAAKAKAAELKRDYFAKLCGEHGLPAPVFEYRFHGLRRWRWDVAWPAHRVALEIQGGLFVQGRHTQGAALLDEHEKLNAGACAGWRVLYCTPRSLLAPATFLMLTQALYVTWEV